MVVVTPQRQCVEDKHWIKSVCFRNRQAPCKWEDGDSLLHRVRWEERMCSLDCRLERRVLPGGIATVDQKELQKQLWEDTLPLPISHISCFLLFPAPLSLLEAAYVVAEINKWIKSLHLYYSKIYKHY